MANSMSRARASRHGDTVGVAGEGGAVPLPIARAGDCEGQRGQWHPTAVYGVYARQVVAAAVSDMLGSVATCG